MKTGKKIIVFLFIVFIFATAAIGVKLVFKNLITESYEFKESGYAITLGNKKDVKSANIYTFSHGKEYSYKKLNNKITFDSEENGNINVDDSTVLHYSNGSISVLKDTVGIDLTKLNTNIIMYYNIFKNTTIEYNSGKYIINTVDGNQTTFSNLLLRINENKYLLLASDIRLVIDGVITTFDNYVYIEYTEGEVIQLYNDKDYNKVISNGAKITTGSTVINIDNGVIYEENKAKLTLSNLIIDYDGNVDVIPEEEMDLTLPELKNSKVDLPVSSLSSSTTFEENAGEIVEEEVPETPVYKVVDLNITPNSVEAKIEITDKDGLLKTGTHIEIVENATNEKVYETDSELGNEEIPITYTGLNPDTEYTIYAEATYKLNELDYTRTFVTKIFRTEAIGIYFEKDLVASETIDFTVRKETYSKVDELKVGLYNESGVLVDTKTIKFNGTTEVSDTFYDLTSNTKYILKLTDIVIDGVVEENGYVENISFSTLKKAPTIGELQYQINKKEAGFNIKADSVLDPDHGINSYRYEIYDARMEINEQDPIMTINSDNAGEKFISVDGVKLSRGTAYTYVLVIEFNDNEKIVEYSKTLNDTMQLDGVKFPTVSWQSTYVTWEQINGTIIVNDEAGTVVSDTYKIVYHNSIDTYKSVKITADSITGNIPININGLRANETYTFEVYADVNLQDGNQTADEAYIGCIYVQTGVPNPFKLTLSSNKASEGFSVNVKLRDSNQSAAFEAGTLSNITFTLYQGSTTNGAVVASFNDIYVPRTGDEEGPYNSTLKTKYYDNYTTITNASFGITNPEDLTARAYTLVVSGTVDYTDYKNELPIEGTTSITFSIDNYTQKKCQKQNNAMKVQAIQNRNAYLYDGVEYDPNLNSTTIVGYRVLADYSDADINTAVKARFYTNVWNPNTESFERLSTYKDVEFNKDGELDYVVFPVDYGTTHEYDTDKLRRGNYYYFNFEVYVDTNGDKIIDGIWPQMLEDGWECGSAELSTPKQKSNFVLYPSYVEGTTAKWKYKYDDVDNALVSNMLNSYSNGTNVITSSAPIAPAQEFSTVEFKNLDKNAFYSIKKNEKLVSNVKDTNTVLAQGYNYSITNNLNLSYSLEKTDNYLIISVDDYDNKSGVVSQISRMNITVEPVEQNIKDQYGVKTFNNVRFTTGQYRINLYDIANYKDHPIKVTIVVNFDTGISGFDVGGTTTAIQRLSIDGPAEYYIDSNGSLRSTGNSPTQTYEVTLDPDDSTLNVKTKGQSKVSEIPVIIDSTGVVYDNNTLTLKKIKDQNLTPTTESITFNYIKPGISMLNAAGRTTITTGLNFAQINPKIYIPNTDLRDTNEDGQACTDCIFIELSKTDVNGGNVEYLRTLAIPQKTLNSVYTINELIPDTNYYIQFYTYVNQCNESGGNCHYEKTYLYDIDEQYEGVLYYFRTSNVVKVENVDLKFKSDSYQDKFLELSYTLSSITGYDGVKYLLEEWDGSRWVESGINFELSDALVYSMDVVVQTPPSNQNIIKWGKRYRINITPYGNYSDNGVMKEVELSTTTEEFTLSQYVTPSIIITNSKTSSQLIFGISVVDTDHIIVDDKYDIRIYDENDRIIYSETDINDENYKRIVLDQATYDLIDGSNYTIVVLAKYDYNNNGTPSTYYDKQQRKTVSFGSGITIGNVTATASISEDDLFSLELSFSQSYGISMIDMLSYSITDDSSGEYIYSTTTGFSLKAYNDIYTHVLNIPRSYISKFETNKVYTINLNFYINEGDITTLVGQEDVRFVYGG